MVKKALKKQIKRRIVARRKIRNKRNLINPLLPLLIAQKQNNSNIDDFNNIRNRNNILTEQQINQNQQRVALENENKKLEQMNKADKEEIQELKTQHKILQNDVERLQKEKTESENLKKEIINLAHNKELLDKDYNIVNQQNEIDAYKTLIEEAKHKITLRKKELEENKNYATIENFKKKTAELDEEANSLAEQIRFYKSDRGFAELKKAQHAKELLTRKVNVRKEALELNKKNNQLRIQLESSLTENELKNLNEEERNKLIGLTQENIRLESQLRDKNSAIDVYNTNRKKVDDLEQKIFDNDLELKTMEAQYNYDHIGKGLDLQKDIINKTIEVAEKEKAIELLKTRNENEKHLITQQINFEKLKRITNSNDLSQINKLNCAQQILEETAEETNKKWAKYHDIIDNINSLYNKISPEGHERFRNKHPMFYDKYQVGYNPYSDNIDSLIEYRNSLSKYIHELDTEESK